MESKTNDTIKIINSQEQLNKLITESNMVIQEEEGIKVILNCDILNYCFKNINFNKINGFTFIKCTFENVSFTDQMHCYFSHCVFKHCNFNHASITRVTFKHCNFDSSLFSFSIFQDIVFLNCNISSTNLFSYCTYITSLEFSGSKSKINFKYICSPMFLPICPEGNIIGYKKVLIDYKNNIRGIAKLFIPNSAKRVNAVGRKCRCDKAKVLSIISLVDGKKYTQAQSFYNSDFIYEVGKIVKVDNFCENRWIECAPGIHFFLTEEEAIDY